MKKLKKAPIWALIELIGSLAMLAWMLLITRDVYQHKKQLKQLEHLAPYTNTVKVLGREVPSK